MFKQLFVARLVDSLTTALPFGGAENQMLLKAVGYELRLANFIALIDGDVLDSVTRY